MKKQKIWFKIVIYLMLAAMVISTLLVVIEPLLY